MKSAEERLGHNEGPRWREQEDGNELTMDPSAKYPGGNQVTDDSAANIKSRQGEARQGRRLVTRKVRRRSWNPLRLPKVLRTKRQAIRMKLWRRRVLNIVKQ